MINDLVRQITAGNDTHEPRHIDYLGMELMRLEAGEGAAVLAPPRIGLTTRLMLAYPLAMFTLGKARSALCVTPTQAFAFSREKHMKHLQQRLGIPGTVVFRPWGEVLNGIQADLVLLDWFDYNKGSAVSISVERDMQYFLSYIWMRRGPNTRFVVGGNSYTEGDPLRKMTEAMYNNGDKILRFDALHTERRYDERGDKHVSTYSLDHVRWPVKDYEKLRKEDVTNFEAAFNHKWLSKKLHVAKKTPAFTEYRKND